MSDDTLSAIRRRNIKQDNLGALIRRYRQERIPTYTEVILGLPGESAESFRAGVGKLLELGQHEALLIYLCEVLPNSELANLHYRQVHGIRTVRMPLLLAYVTPNEDDVTEYFEIVIETATMSSDDWRDSLIFSWFVQCFHCLNITQGIALFLHAYRGLPYETFYGELLRFSAEQSDGLLGRLQQYAVTIVTDGLRGFSMGQVVPDFGGITWNPEEALFLTLIRHKTQLYADIDLFLTTLNTAMDLCLSEELRADLVAFQRASLVAPFEPAKAAVYTSHRLPEFFAHAYMGEVPSLVRERRHVDFTAARAYDDLGIYALEALRYGRKNNGLRRFAA